MKKTLCNWFIYSIIWSYHNNQKYRIDLINEHAPISAQSSNLVVFRLQPVYFYLLLYKTYVVGTHLNSNKYQQHMLLWRKSKKCCVCIIKYVPHEVRCLSFFQRTDLSLSVPVLAGYFITSFSSNFEKLAVQSLERIRYLDRPKQTV